LVVDVAGYACINASVIGCAVRSDVIIASIVGHEGRESRMIGSGVNRSITSPISAIGPDSTAPQCGFERSRGVEIYVYAHRVAD